MGEGSRICLKSPVLCVVNDIWAQPTQMWEEERAVGHGTQLYSKSINRVKPMLGLCILCFIKLCLEVAVSSREVKDEEVCRACCKHAAARIYGSAWLYHILKH